MPSYLPDCNEDIIKSRSTIMDDKIHVDRECLKEIQERNKGSLVTRFFTKFTQYIKGIGILPLIKRKQTTESIYLKQEEQQNYLKKEK